MFLTVALLNCVARKYLYMRTYLFVAVLFYLRTTFLYISVCHINAFFLSAHIKAMPNYLMIQRYLTDAVPAAGMPMPD